MNFWSRLKYAVFSVLACVLIGLAIVAFLLGGYLIQTLFGWPDPVGVGIGLTALLFVFFFAVA